MNISIITPYTNTPELMRNYLQITLPIINKYGYELVLVRDAECSIEMMNEIEEMIKGNDLVKNITDKTSQGCSIVNNKGVDNASNELVLFINNDVFLKEDTAELMKEKLLSDDKIGIVQALTLYPNSGLVQSAGHVFGDYFNTHCLVNRNPKDKIVQTEAERQGITNACYMMKKSLFYQFHGYDEYFYNAWEGLELSIRVHEAGYKLIYYPKAVAYHIQGSSRESIYRNEDYQSAYFWTKHQRLLACDFHKLIKQQLDDISTFSFDDEVVFINGSTYSYNEWQPLIDLFKGKVSKTSIVIFKKGAPIKLEEKVNLAEYKEYKKIIYLCDNYTNIKSNKYMFAQRDSSSDLVIDITGNVIEVKDF
ncbi:MAG: glycosyltransferase [Bacilli bacterium]|nr:glycosyltransferase [Bacilli bacterium]